ncbi:hypothetical protein DSC45_02470 [Streptomyces sp. YIM 130001]|uniref:SCO4983 family protein n=1 Tax=Streptomyces sp. YIM 130001 TaxID=2259644 RepID=UPI000E64DAB6|nr:hypothetical protein [Streptomyces sp. YIM 130001]RII20969.1 hypothetical protein DSC45_02470 [Streptomyces sp. YIM 130001]
MYEPIRTQARRSVSSARWPADEAEGTDFPHRSRAEELDIQLAGHLAALLAVTDELRARSAPEGRDELDAAAERLVAQISRIRGEVPARGAAAGTHDPAPAALHRRAHALAGRALVVAASRADTTSAILAAQRMDAHEAAVAASAAELASA